MSRVWLAVVLLSSGCKCLNVSPGLYDADCTECSGDGGVFAQTKRCTFRCVSGCIELQCTGDGGLEDVPLVQGIAEP